MKTPSQSAAGPAKTGKKHPGLKIVLAVLALIILILAVLPIFINPIAESLVKQQAAAIFGDKLKIGGVNVSFLTGAVVKISRIELAQAPGFGEGSLLKAAGIKVRVSLKPLLHKQLEIKDITITRPEIYIIQYKNGNTNLDYYLAKFSGEKAGPASGTPVFILKLDKFGIKKGRIILASYAISGQHQPTLILTDSYLSVYHLIIPNPDKVATRFSFSALLGTSHPAQIRTGGRGVFGGNTLSFTLKSKVSNLALADYAYLTPNSRFTVKSGRAWITSDASCRNNYLNSYQHVDIKGLKLKPKKGHALSGTILGTPANIFMKAIENRNGILNFDFTISGYLSDLKVNIKLKIIQSITKSFGEKLGLSKLGQAATSGVKKIDHVFTGVFKGLFKHKKNQ